MASKDKPAAKKAGKKKNGYEQPKHLKAGSTIIDNYKKSWKIGTSIGNCHHFLYNLMTCYRIFTNINKSFQTIIRYWWFWRNIFSM